MRVAWIGLGHMGLPTAKLVAAGGHEVRGFDINPPDLQDAHGLTLWPSSREAAAGCEIVCLAVFSDEQVEEVLTGPEGLYAVLEPGAIIAIFTTGTIEAVRRLAASAPARVSVLDTCFSRAGSMTSDRLNLLVGGDAEALRHCTTVFDAFAAEIFHLGGCGAGRAMKLVNNLLWVAHNQVLMDALDFADALGFDRYEAAKIINKCTGGSRVTETFTKPYDDMVAYMLPFMVKDASAAAEAAREAGVDLGTLGHVAKKFIR